MDAANDGGVGDRPPIVANHLGRRLPVGPPDHIWRRQLRLVGDQRQFVLRASRAGTSGYSAFDPGPIVQRAARKTMSGLRRSTNAGFAHGPKSNGPHGSTAPVKG